MLFSDEEKAVQLGEKPVDKKVESAKEVSEFGSTHVVEESEKVDFFLVYSNTFVFCSCNAHTCTSTRVRAHTHTHTRVRPYIFLLYKINSSLVKSLKTLESIKQKISGPSLQEPFSVAGLLDASRPHARRMCRCPLRLSPSRVFFYVLVFMLAFSLHVCSF